MTSLQLLTKHRSVESWQLYNDDVVVQELRAISGFDGKLGQHKNYGYQVRFILSNGAPMYRRRPGYPCQEVFDKRFVWMERQLPLSTCH